MLVTCSLSHDWLDSLATCRRTSSSFTKTISGLYDLCCLGNPGSPSFVVTAGATKAFPLVSSLSCFFLSYGVVSIVFGVLHASLGN